MKIPDSAVAGSRRLGRYVVAGAIVLAILAAGGLYLRSRSTHPATTLTEKDTVVLADFTNSTGDPVFDGTLKQALAVDLEQSPFLNILSDSKAGETLKLMGRAPPSALREQSPRNFACARAARPWLRVPSPPWAASM